MTSANLYEMAQQNGVQMISIWSECLILMSLMPRSDYTKFKVSRSLHNTTCYDLENDSKAEFQKGHLKKTGTMVCCRIPFQVSNNIYGFLSPCPSL